MQLQYKGIEIELSEPPYPARTEEFRAMFPLGKIPALELADGTMIGESTAIMEYIEAIHPAPATIPSDALAKAQNEMLVRYVDNHLSVGLSPLFQEFFGLVHSGASPEPNEQRFELLNLELDKLESLLTQLPGFELRSLQTGDFCLASNLYYVETLTGFFGGQRPWTERPMVQAWNAWAHGQDCVSDQIAIMDDAHQAMLANL